MTELETLKKQINELSKQVRNNVTELSKKDTQIKNLTLKINDLNETMTKKMDNLRIKLIEIGEKDKSIKNLKNEVNHVQNQINSIHKQEEKNEMDNINLLKMSAVIHEIWDKYTLSEGLIINQNENKVSLGYDGYVPCVFGTQIIKSGINIWRFRFEKGKYIYIGIINEEKVKKQINFPNNVPDSYTCTSDGYSYNQTKKSKDNGLKFGQGDILCMCLNMHQAKLLFSVNNKPFKSMFDNIDTSLKYKMGICIGSANVSLKLECCMHID